MQTRSYSIPQAPARADRALPQNATDPRSPRSYVASGHPFPWDPGDEHTAARILRDAGVDVEWCPRCHLILDGQHPTDCPGGAR